MISNGDLSKLYAILNESLVHAMQIEFVMKALRWPKWTKSFDYINSFEIYMNSADWHTFKLATVIIFV